MPSMTHLMGCWYSRSYCFVLGLKMSHCTGFGMPTCAHRLSCHRAHGRRCSAEAPAHHLTLPAAREFKALLQARADAAEKHASWRRRHVAAVCCTGRAPQTPSTLSAAVQCTLSGGCQTRTRSWDGRKSTHGNHRLKHCLCRTRFMKAVRSGGNMCHTVAAPSNLPISLTIAATTWHTGSAAHHGVRPEPSPPFIGRSLLPSAERATAIQVAPRAADAVRAAGAHDSHINTVWNLLLSTQTSCLIRTSRVFWTRVGNITVRFTTFSKIISGPHLPLLLLLERAPHDRHDLLLLLVQVRVHLTLEHLELGLRMVGYAVTHGGHVLSPAQPMRCTFARKLQAASRCFWPVQHNSSLNAATARVKPWRTAVTYRKLREQGLALLDGHLGLYPRHEHVHFLLELQQRLVICAPADQAVDVTLKTLQERYRRLAVFRRAVRVWAA